MNGPRPCGWFPKVAGERLRGRIKGFSEGSTPFGPRRIVELDTEDGVRALWLSSRVLESKFTDADPKPGDLLDVTYCGRHPTKQYHLWEVTTSTPARKKRRARRQPRLPGLTSATPIADSPRPAPPPDSTGEDPFSDF